MTTRSRRFFPLALALAVLALALAPAALAQSPRGSVEAMVGSATVSVDYGRPSLKGRDMLAQAADGMVWRLGADQATTLTTSAAIKIGDTNLDAGSYSLFARKSGDDWVLLVNSQTGQWGTEHDASMDVAEVPLSTMSASPTEQFTITIADHGGTQMIHFTWGETMLMAAVAGGS